MAVHRTVESHILPGIFVYSSADNGKMMECSVISISIKHESGKLRSSSWLAFDSLLAPLAFHAVGLDVAPFIVTGVNNRIFLIGLSA